MFRCSQTSVRWIVSFACATAILAGMPASVAAQYVIGHDGSLRNLDQAKRPPLNLQFSPRTIAEMRQSILGFRPHRLWHREQSDRLLARLAIIGAKSDAERRQWIGRLGVEVREVVTARGTTKYFVAGGKVRGQMFVPFTNRRDDNEAPHGGPDSGDDAAPAAEECFDDDGSPDECVTPEEWEEFLIVAADLEASLAWGEQAYQETYDEMMLLEGGVSGPCASEDSCADYAVNAGAGLVVAWAAHGEAEAAKGKYLAQGGKYAKKAMMRTKAVAIAGAFVVGWSIGSFINCVAGWTAPEALYAERAFSYAAHGG